MHGGPALRPRWLENLRRAAVLLCGAPAVIGCGGGQTRANDALAATTSRVEVHAADGRPRMSAVARDGDPFSGMALAVAGDFGANGAVFLGTLIEDRIMRAASLSVDVRPSSNGFVIRARVDSPAEASSFVRAARAALSTKLTEAEVSRGAAGPTARVWTTEAERAVGECVAELAAPSAERPALADLERFRIASFGAQTVSFAAAGHRDVLDAATGALRAGDTWPDTKVDDPWPAADVIGTLPSEPSGASVLSIALRVGDPARTLEAAKALGASGSDLSAHLSALEPAWRIARVVGTTRPRGACLRVDLDALHGTVSPSDAAGVAALALEELNRTLGAASGSSWALDQSVLDSTDPRDAAAIAAWAALGARNPPGPERTFVSFGGAAPDEGRAADGTFARDVEAARVARQRPSIEVRGSVEAGQGETWMLLASPCATEAESSQTAGLAAVTVRALAREATNARGVRIEPWVSARGVGLLAHGARTSPNETADDLAARIGAALGRALSATVVTDESAAAARVSLQSELGPETELLWPVALEALAPKHPSLLDPRGTWQSVTELPTHLAELERHALVRGPLRLAVLGNETVAQASAAARAVERWLEPERTTNVACSDVAPLSPHPAEYGFDAPANSQGGSRAIVAVAVKPLPGGGLPPEAAWTAELLNRDNGWLDRSVRGSGLAVHAEATVLGGRSAGALAIEIVAPDDKTREAISQVRAVLARLADGAATDGDVAQARVAMGKQEAALRVDPRNRLVEVWLGRSRAPETPNLASLRRFHHDALAPERHFVIAPRVRP